MLQYTHIYRSMLWPVLEKSTHISMISKYVKHLRSYTSSAIARNSTLISQETLRERRYCCIEWQVFDCFMMFHNVLRVFHDVSQCFKSVSWCFTSGSWCFTTFHDVSQCFTSVSWCFTMLTMFYDVYRVSQPSASQQRRRDRRYHLESDTMPKLCPKWRL